MATSRKMVDALYHKEYSRTYTLTLLLGPDIFRYAIIDERNHNLLAFYEYPLHDVDDRKQALHSILVSEEELQAHYQQINVFLWSEQFALVPAKLWEEDSERALLELIYGNTQEPLHSTHLFDNQIVGVYKLPKKLETWFAEHFPNATIQHATVPLLNHYRKLNAFNGKSKVYAHFSSEMLQITVISDGELTFHNHYRYQSKEDVAYFVLLVYDQLQLSREEVPLILAGGILQDSAVYQLLYRYLSDLHFARLPEKLVVNEKEFEALHKHVIVNLLSNVP